MSQTLWLPRIHRPCNPHISNNTSVHVLLQLTKILPYITCYTFHLSVQRDFNSLSSLLFVAHHLSLVSLGIFAFWSPLALRYLCSGILLFPSHFLSTCYIVFDLFAFLLFWLCLHQPFCLFQFLLINHGVYINLESFPLAFSKHGS